jgi:pimeloyl-ACP methyl ester carboxylesterase
MGRTAARPAGILTIPAGAPIANIVQAAAVQHISVGDLSVGYRVIGPLSTTAASTAAGDRGPLLLIMGSSGTMDLWSPAFVAALAQDRKVIAFDNRGIGETDDPMGAYPFSQLADDTAGLINALGHDRMDILGWSMGGSVAIDLAVRHPDVVSRTISYAGGAGGSQAVMPAPDVIAVLTDTSGTQQQHGERLLELLFPEAHRVAHPDYMRTFPIPTEEAAAEGIDLQNAAIAGWAGVWSGLGGITSPMLFATGTEDVLTPPDNSVLLAERVPGSWLVRFAGAGHGLMYQDPDGLAETVRTFLDVTAPQVGSGR